MIVRLDNGFEATVNPDDLNDMRFLEALAGTEENAFNLPKVCSMLLGEEQKEKLYKHIETDGRVPIDTLTNCVTEIMEKAGDEVKNS